MKLKKLSLAVICFFLLTHFGYSQQNSFTIDKTGFVQVVDLKENGLLVANERLENFDIIRIDAQGNVLWESRLKGYYTSQIKLFTDSSKKFIVSSPSGNRTFAVQWHNKNLLSGHNPVYISSLDDKGGHSDLKFSNQKGELGEYTIASFCDDEYLYFIGTESENPRAAYEKKADAKLILNRFSAQNFDHKMIVLDLPKLENKDEDRFWQYLGQVNNEKFIVLKRINKEVNTAKFTIVSFNSEGEILQKFDVAMDLGQKFMRYVQNQGKKDWNAYTLIDIDNQETFDNGKPIIKPLTGSFVDIKMDETTGEFFMSGIFGPKMIKKSTDSPSGFFVQKFDERGLFLWDLTYGPKEGLAKNKRFNVKNMPAYMKRLSVKDLESQDLLNLALVINKDLFSFAIDKEQGTVTHLKYKKKHHQDYDPQPLIPNTILSSVNYLENISNHQRRYYTHRIIQHPQGDFLMAFPKTNAGKFNLMYFPRPKLSARE